MSDPGPLHRRSALAALGLGALTTALPGWTQPAARIRPLGRSAPIVLGVISEITGPGAAYGIDLLRGAHMAASEINAAGGVRGRPLELLVADGGSHPARSAIAMRRLVSTDAVMVVGGWGSAQVLAHLEVAEDAAMPYIVVGATHPKITSPRNRWTFRVVQTDAMQAEALAAAVVDRLGARRVATLADENAYGLAGRDLFIAALGRRGVKLLRAESYSATATDFTAPLQALQQAAPEVLAVFGTVPAAPELMRQARALGLTARFVGTGGLAHLDLLAQAGTAAEGTLLTGLFHEDTDDAARAWAARYRETFADPAAPLDPPQPQLAAWAYRALRFIAAPCLEQVNPSDRVALRQRLTQWRGPLFGVKGEVSFDAQRQLVQPVLLLEVRGGRFVPWRAGA